MSRVLVSCGLLCLLVGGALSLSHCSLEDFTIIAEKPECDFCVAINTTICTGFCPTLHPNGMGRMVRQEGCMYEELEYRTAKLPGCPPHVDPHFSYPVALDCKCASCDSASVECTERAIRDVDPCSKPLRHIHPHLGLSNHILLL